MLQQRLCCIRRARAPDLPALQADGILQPDVPKSPLAHGRPQALLCAAACPSTTIRRQPRWSARGRGQHHRAFPPVPVPGGGQRSREPVSPPASLEPPNSLTPFAIVFVISSLSPPSMMA